MFGSNNTDNPAVSDGQISSSPTSSGSATNLVEGATPASSTFTSSNPTTTTTTNNNSNTTTHANATATPSSPPSTKSSSTLDKKSRRTSSSTASSFISSAKNMLSHGSTTIHNEKTVEKSQTSAGGAGAGASAASLEEKKSTVNPDPTNNAAGLSKPSPTQTFLVGVSEDKNRRCRRTMEDTHSFLYNFLPPNPPTTKSPKPQSKTTNYSSLEENAKGNSDNGYFAVFDGHAGCFAADWCGAHLHDLLEDTIRSNPTKAIPEVLDLTFTNVDKELKDLPVKNSGCTAVAAVLRWEDSKPSPSSPTPDNNNNPSSSSSSSSSSKKRMLYTANVGDARIVLCRAGKALRLSYDHKGSDENEGKRVSNAGGLILNNRVNGVLAVTRALGDSYIKDLVTGHPYTTETMIEGDLDEFLILACDGLWDVCSDQEAVDHVRTVQDPQEASRMLVEHALARFSTDNLSCMVVRLEKPKEHIHSTVQGAGLGLEGLLGGGAQVASTSQLSENAVADEDVVMEDVESKDITKVST